jgi:peptidoglycan/LPS O-acetylase OafA/YrhL
MSAPADRAALAGAIPSLDGIRAVAVSLVFLAHSGLERFVPGGLGVTIFFVLSGYLISSLMRVEYGRSGGIALGGFYLRRLLRLMPPLIVAVVLTGTFAALGLIGGGFSLGGLLAALFYGGNYHVIFNDFQGMPAGLGVVWSLAIEEHYYLLYPPLAVLLLRARPRVAAAVLLALCAGVLGWRCVLLASGASSNYMTMATDTRVDAILVGCAMALWRNPWLDAEVSITPHGPGGLALAAVLVLAATLLFRDESFRLTARFSLQSIAVAVLIWHAVAHSGRAPWRWLNLRPVVYLGTISYTVYLVHHAILLGLARRFPDWGWPALTLAAAALTVAIAEPMRRWVEVPCADLRRRLHRQALERRATRAPHLVGAP